MHAFLAIFSSESGQAEIFRQRVLPFGSLATAFLRVSLAIWAIGNGLSKLAWPAYFDDFRSLCEDAASKRADVCISAIFASADWKLSGDQLTPFDSVCEVWGVQLGLSSARLGTVFVSNIQEKIEELTADIADLIKAGALSAKDGEGFRGRLQFANTQPFVGVL